MADRRCDVAIIGAGTAGLKAFRAATEAGPDTLLIERGPGGSTCTRVGCMPSKLLLAAGRRAFAVRHAGIFGIQVQDVRVNGAAVLKRLRAERDRFTQAVLDEYHAIAADRRIHGTARFVGPDTLAVGDDRIVAKAVIIATGGHPIIPEDLQPVRSLVHTHETIFDIPQLPRRMAVLGAGPLGIELAQAFARLGVEVTVLEEGTAPGGLADPETGKIAGEALGQEMTLHFGVKVTTEPAGDEARVAWTGESSGEVTVELILAAAGRPPSLDELDLAKAGVPLDDRGTPVFDETTRRCGDSNVFIAGDAGAWRPVLHEAARGGRIAGHVAAGGAPFRPLPSFQVAFTEPNLVEVGTPFDKLPDGARIGCAAVADNGRAVVDGETRGLVRLYGDAGGKLIGASIVAPEGEHLGHLVALGIDRGISVAEFADQPWYHPTLEETLQQAARDLAGIEA